MNLHQSGTYRTVVADPPWAYDWKDKMATSTHRGRPEGHYETTDLEWIKSLPVAEWMAGDAHLWLWAVNGMMREAHDVVEAWGFRPVQIVTWCKPGPGTGWYLRANTEHAIFATRGKPMTPEPANRPTSTWYQWPRGRHSAKPDAFLDLVERMSPGPYLEMFARRARFGWDYWGDQSLGSAEVAA